jgi:hypothetical protein
LDKLQSVTTKKKQSESIFDDVIHRFPAFSHHLSVDADIVQNKEFENAVCKIINGFPASLTKSAVQGFQKAADKREVAQS